MTVHPPVQAFSPGWYPQPDGTQRYWDGSQWTPHVAAGAGAGALTTGQFVGVGHYATSPGTTAANASAKKRNWFARHAVLTGLVVLMLLFSLFSAARAMSNGSGTAVSPSASTGTASHTTATASPSPTSAADKAAAGTVSQQNAVRSAEGYLDFTAFSRSGLIGQLKFEGFTSADATYAVDTLNIDWNEQAAKSAKSYLEMTSFSHSSLVAQLKFEGFTDQQAEYGVQQAGL
ncbi:MAG: Ltp family lipoprotein [Lapillicoccus sp.]